MERKIVWTEQASGDIEAIVRYIARRDPNAASRIGLGIYDRVQILQQNPGAGSILDELRTGRLAQAHLSAMEYTPSETRQLSLGESGRRPWERPIWRRHHEGI